MIDILLDPTFRIVVSIFLFIFGLFMGSFFNVLADRLPHGKTVLGRSHCDSCKHVLAWYDLFPIISFTVLQAKCRYCKSPLSYQYPLSEIFTGVIFVLTWYLSFQWSANIVLAVLNLAMVSVLIVMVLSDFRYQILPDEMQVSLLILGVLQFLYMKIFIGSYTSLELLQSFGLHVLYGGVVLLPLFLVFILSKGRGMGFGDVKFAFSMGFILGLWGGLGALYLGFISGGLVGGVMLLLKRGSLKTKIPFGPFLIFGFYMMLFFEHEIILLLGRIYGF